MNSTYQIQVAWGLRSRDWYWACLWKHPWRLPCCILPGVYQSVSWNPKKNPIKDLAQRLFQKSLMLYECDCKPISEVTCTSLSSQNSDHFVIYSLTHYITLSQVRMGYNICRWFFPGPFATISNNCSLSTQKRKMNKWIKKLHVQGWCGEKSKHNFQCLEKTYSQCSILEIDNKITFPLLFHTPRNVCPHSPPTNQNMLQNSNRWCPATRYDINQYFQ